MPEQTIKDKTAIAGIGWTAFSRKSGVTTLSLAAEASLKAIADAGLRESFLRDVAQNARTIALWERWTRDKPG